MIEVVTGLWYTVEVAVVAVVEIAAVVAVVVVEEGEVAAVSVLGEKFGVEGGWRDFLLELEGAHREVPHVGVEVEGSFHH